MSTGRLARGWAERVNVFEVTGVNPLLEIAQELEKIALEDEYFVKRKLYPNVDFYSGIIYRLMGIPKNMFTVIFALGRLPGWIAHWRELHLSPDKRIHRPRQLYVGPPERPFVPVIKRVLVTILLALAVPCSAQLGVVMGMLAFIRYKKVERQIDDDTYKSSAIMSVLLALSVLAIGAFLVLYLVHSM